MLEPTLAEVQREAIRSVIDELHTALPGTVVSYDKATQTADIQPAIKRSITKLDGGQELEKLPVLPFVPIVWMRAGGYSLRLPLAEGDHVLLIFSEAATAHWRATGQLAEPGDLTRHDLSYAFAIPGIAPDAGVLTPQVDDLAFFDGGVWRFGGGALGTDAKFVAIAELVMNNLNALKDAINGWIPVPNDGGAALKTALSALFAGPPAWPEDVEATKLKAE